MKTTKKLITLFLLLATVSGLHAEGEKVLTIYFAGTKFDEYSDFKGYSELISELYADHESSDVWALSTWNFGWTHSAYLDPNSGPKYKCFIKGVGAHKPLGEQCLLCAGNGFIEWFDCRNYYVCLNEAKEVFKQFVAAESGDLIVNLVGFSRGGVLTMMMADWVGENYKNVTINILAVDPVPGVSADLDHAFEAGDPITKLLGEQFDFDFRIKVNQFIGIYAEDEMTAVFEPILPQLDPDPVKYLLYSLRGSHETLVGNTDSDGNPDSSAGTTNPVLRCDYNICRGTAELIFNGPEWGGTVFDNMPENEEVAESNFYSAVTAMNSYPAEGYDEMRWYNFNPLWWSNFGGYENMFQNFGFVFLTVDDKEWAPERLIFRWPYDLPERNGRVVVFFLNQKTDEFVSSEFYDHDGSYVFSIVAEEQPIIKSLYGDGYMAEAYATWYKLELLRGYPVPDVPDLPPISGECPFTLPVPTATDITDGQMLPVHGVPDTGLTRTLPGRYTVIWTYTDIEGNASTQTQEVVVLDTTPPVPDIDPLPEVRGQCSAEITEIPTATDTVAGTVFGTTADPLFYMEQGEYTVTWIYDDGYGNAATQAQHVVVKDDIPPIIENISVSPAVLWPPNHKMCDVVIDITTSDNCDSAPISRIIEVKCNEVITNSGDGKKGPDWEMTGDLNIDLRAERSSKGSGRVYEITVECADKNGNSSTDVVCVRVPKSMGAARSKKSR